MRILGPCVRCTVFSVLLMVTLAPVRAADTFPFRLPPVDYAGPRTLDRMATLRAWMDAGEDTLVFEEGQGYLLSLLETLKIPVESQVLVFSKTSVNARLISPRTPRAVYFNDEVYVGWVPKAPALEISAVDPQKGMNFYTIPQIQGQPRVVRETNCLVCHASSNTLNVPGHLLRSYQTDNAGNPKSGFPRVTHDLPIVDRWGGWYVTGASDQQVHRGNLLESSESVESEPPAGGAVDLGKRFNVTRYPLRTSDVTALLVLDHQTHLQNLLTRVSFEHRHQRRENSEEKLLRYLLFADEAELDVPVPAKSPYAVWFEKQGLRDRQGRSLREMDLQTRLLKYRCSYLIYTSAFDALPFDVTSRLYRRLWEVLTGYDISSEFSKIPLAERQAIFEILRDTKSGLPDYW